MNMQNILSQFANQLMQINEYVVFAHQIEIGCSVLSLVSSVQSLRRNCVADSTADIHNTLSKIRSEPVVGIESV